MTGERIRDKIAASKRRGMWMGGRTPLGYAVEHHKLVVVPDDAAIVVQLYRRYLDLGSVRVLKEALDAEGIVSKPRTFSTGTEAGGTPYSRGALYALLSNPVYLGQVRHKAVCYPGQHEAIVPADLHAAVQAQLAASNNGATGRPRAKVEPSLLAGKLFDHAGERLVPSHARKGERRYRYYVSASLLRPSNAITDAASDRDPSTAARARTDSTTSNTPSTGTDPSRAGPAPGWRLPAREIEQAVWAAAVGILQQPSLLVPDLLVGGLPPERLQAVLDHLSSLAQSSGPSAGQHTQQDGLGLLVDRVELSPEGLMLTLRIDGQSSAGRSSDGGTAHDAHVANHSTLTLSRFVPHRVHRRGTEMRLVIAAATGPGRDDAALLKVVARAHCWFEALAEGRVASVHALAGRLGMTSRYVQRVLPLALLAPILVKRIAAGHHAASLTVDKLTDGGPLPQRWDEQVRHLEG